MPRSRDPSPQDNPAAREISGLRIVRESDRMDQSPPPQATVAPDEVEFRLVAAAINLGLGILETGPGRATLADLGVQIVESWRDFEHIYEDHLDNMSWWVGLFLQRLRATFPTVILTTRMRGEGITRRANWARDGVKMRQWDPPSAGLLKLNKTIVSNMAVAATNASQTQDQDEQINFESFMFLMAITVAHELMHFFVGFLTGYDTPLTPEDVDFLPETHRSVRSNETAVGESGRAFEGALFGGVVSTFYSRSDPLGNRQAGLLYIVDSSHRARRVDHRCVRRNLDFNFDFPFATVGRSKSIRDLYDERDTMTSIRASLLPPGLVPARSRSSSGSVSRNQLEQLRRLPSYSFRDRSFDLILRITRQPRYLFATA